MAAIPAGQKRYIGIDGGGTKTACLIGDEHGHVLHIGYGGASNVKSNSRAETHTVLIQLLELAIAQTGSSVEQIAGITLSLAGGHRVEDRQRMIASLAPFFSEGTDIEIHSDSVAAWAAGTWGEAGIALIAGTGSIAYGRLSLEGAEVRAGGWGYLLGDEGSGFAIAIKALQTIMRSYDLRAPATCLSSAILNKLALAEPEALIDWVYENSHMRKEVAALSVCVVDAAQAGDSAAAAIVNEALEELLRLVQSVEEQLLPYAIESDGGPITGMLPIYTAGGMFSNPYFYNQFVARLHRERPHAQCQRLELPPVAGAYYMALHRAGLAHSNTKEQVLSTLVAINGANS